jgi:hypothetical protein
MHLRIRYVCAVAACLAAAAWHGPVSAQSRAVSEASTASMQASVEVPIAIYEALKAGGRFTITGLQASARGTVMTISLAPALGSVLLVGLIEPDFNLSESPDSSIGKVLVVSAGLLLMLGEKVVAFIPQPRARAHIHSRRLTP